MTVSAGGPSSRNSNSSSGMSAMGKEEKSRRSTTPLDDEGEVGSVMTGSYSFKNATFCESRGSAKASGPGGRSTWKNAKQILAAEHCDKVPYSVPTYTNIEAQPSALPARAYCDLTGLRAKYTDPRTRLRFAKASLFGIIRSLPPDAVYLHLSLRNAHVNPNAVRLP